MRASSVLGVSPDASEADLRRAFHAKAFELHPDRHPEHERASWEDKFKALGAAYREARKDLRHRTSGANHSPAPRPQPIDPDAATHEENQARAAKRRDTARKKRAEARARCKAEEAFRRAQETAKQGHCTEDEELKRRVEEVAAQIRAEKAREKDTPRDPLLPPTFKFKNAGDVLVGVLVGVSPGKIAWGGFMAQGGCVELPDGQRRAFWLTTDLNAERLGRIPVGSKVRIEFTGMECGVKRFSVGYRETRAA